MYEAEQIVSMIEELNSVSTFHRWRKLAEECCDISFQKKTKQVGTTSYTKYYLFSDSDIENFRKVAILRNKGHPIREAVIKTFEVVAVPDPLPEQNKQLIDNLIQAVAVMNIEVQKLLKLSMNYERQSHLSTQKVYQLEQQIQELEAGKMDKPFQRKKA
ncbi:hypothetical protein CKN86_06830 [Carnobacterium divergens]|uniref:hypothetical protein n=1 Tax=Carnobacterium divergens TaxID=2748 RepID=UPI000D436C0F|nr:hypothetical protein [Carnobacterium divergens]MCO6016914.1 hypothetical protein [Carnobacterium divergens]TFI62547.1 hypothetical protein CKN62_06865 [Carnobacterium divergens]TFI89749.1 hypothetical protein CKN84_06865 [Carnobacterium divergens]TFJ04804.1 hypothetical protein CKN86_06830 [Carnobacterium divergens]TFJ06294.1 hypothetical protein CKN65_06870 [Carnobacterium divergens]